MGSVRARHELDVIRYCANEAAEAFKELYPRLTPPLSFIANVFTVPSAAASVFRKENRTIEDDLVFADLRQLVTYLNRRNTFIFDQLLPFTISEPTAFLMKGSPDVYQRAVYRLVNFDYGVLSSGPCAKADEPTVDRDLRDRLCKMLSAKQLSAPSIVRFLPVTLLEGLESLWESISLSVRAPVGTILLDTRVSADERYLALVSYLKDRGSYVIGLPHGGCYSQRETVSYYELVERSLSDVFADPSWGSPQGFQQFPSIRYSSVLLLSKRNRVVQAVSRWFEGRRKKEVLVVLPLIETGDAEATQLRVSQIESWLRKLFPRVGDCSTGVYLKCHPKESDDVLQHLEVLSDSLSIVRAIEEEQFLQLMYNYRKVIFYCPEATGIWECVASNVPPFINLSGSRLDPSYQAFLERECSALLIKDSKDIEFTDRRAVHEALRHMRRAYRISWLFPFEIVRTVRRINSRLSRVT